MGMTRAFSEAAMAEARMMAGIDRMTNAELLAECLRHAPDFTCLYSERNGEFVFHGKCTRGGEKREYELSMVASSIADAKRAVLEGCVRSFRRGTL